MDALNATDTTHMIRIQENDTDNCSVCIAQDQQ